MYTPTATTCRNILLTTLARQPGRTFTVTELVPLLADVIGRTGRRPGQVVSDVLRMPVGRGWVVREGRGRYRFGSMPSTSLRRAHRWDDARRSGLNPSQCSAFSNWRTVPTTLSHQRGAGEPTWPRLPAAEAPAPRFRCRG